MAPEISNAALSLPIYLPAGCEAAALRAFSTAFQAALLGPLLASACQALHSLQFSKTPLAMAAAGLTFHDIQSMQAEVQGVAKSSPPAISVSTDAGNSSVVASSMEHVSPASHSQRPKAPQKGCSSLQAPRLQKEQQTLRQPDQHKAAHNTTNSNDNQQTGVSCEAGVLYPLEAFPDQADCCEALLHGYSSAWLGLVPAPNASHQAAPHSYTQSHASLLEPTG